MTATNGTHRDSRAGIIRLLEMAIAGPPIALLAFGILVVCGAAIGIDPLWRNSQLNLPEAATFADHASIERLLSAGHRATAVDSVRPKLLGNSEVRVTALQAAVAIDNPDVLRRLLAARRVAPRRLRRLWCLALATGADATAQVLAETPDVDTLQGPCRRARIPW